MDFRNRVLLMLGESSGVVLVYAIITGVLVAIGKFLLTSVLKRLGVDYFAEIAESYRWIGQIVIEARHVLNADRASFYRCSNGKYYLENLEDIDTSGYAAILPSHEEFLNKNIKVYSVANKTRNKGITQLPETLDDTYFEWFLQLQKTDSYVEQFTTDLPENSKLRNNLDKYSIISYFAVKIKQNNELYGILVFTWSDVKQMPKNLVTSNREYLGSLKNTLLLETLFIVDRTVKFKISNFFNFFK